MKISEKLKKLTNNSLQNKIHDEMKVILINKKFSIPKMPKLM